METRRLVLREDVATTFRALRSGEFWMYRLTPAGRRAVANVDGVTRRVLVAILENERPGADGWVAESPVVESAFPGTDDIYYARSTLKRHTAEPALVERTLSRPAARVPLYTLSPQGEDVFRRRFLAQGQTPPAPTRRPGPSNGVHHLLTVEAAIRILHRARGDLQMVRLWGDEDLRSQSRKGRTLKAGESDVPLPDGRLHARRGGGAFVTADIEILVSKYSDAQILKKYDELDARRTGFFAPTARLVDRVRTLVGRVPVLLS